MTNLTLGPFSWERMIRAVEKVRERLKRATSALNDAKVPYAVIGGNAVAAWVSRVDESAVRNTQDVDLLIRRDDFDAAKLALESAGFIYRKVGPITMFLDGPNVKPRHSVHVIFADEKVRDDYVAPAASVEDAEMSNDMPVLALESLVRMKLTSYRDKDRTHLRDLIDVELVDDTWPQKYQPELAERLQALLDDPDG